MDIVKHSHLDQHIDNFNAEINQIIASGSTANLDRLLSLVHAIESCFHHKVALDHRAEHKRRTRWVEEKHPESIRLKQNDKSSNFHSAQGWAKTLTAALQGAITIGGAFAGTDPKMIKSYMSKAALGDQLAGGFGAFASANQSADQTRSLTLDFAIEREKNEIRENQEAQQSAQSQRQEALRRRKEALDAEANARLAIARGG